MPDGFHLAGVSLRHGDKEREGRTEDGRATERASERAREGEASWSSHLGHELPVLLVQVGCGRHVVLPDADLALFGRSGQEEQKKIKKKVIIG